MTARPLSVALAALTLLPLLVGGSVAAETPTEPLVIGAIVNKAAGCASGGSTDVDAMRFAVAQINAAGGVNGLPVELHDADGKCSVAGARAAFNSLRTNLGATAILFTGTDAQLAELAKLAEQTQTVLVAARAGGTNATAGKDYLFTARVHPFNLTEGVAMVEQATKTDGGPYQVVYMGDDYGYDVVLGIVNSLEGVGAQYRDPIGIDPLAPKYLEAATQVAMVAETTDFDTVLFAGDAEQLGGFVQALHDIAGLDSVDLYAPGAAYGAHLFVGNDGTGKSLVDDVVIVGIALNPSLHSTTSTFLTDYVEAVGSEANVYAEYAYDAVAVVALAAETADDHSGPGIQQY
ncbi:MAG TPA: ABC transporter substrate-binding protein, partial [Candidatus Thermoplasmatota archaeon]|nr:ABC transporter substrate-binding protein [Candidatus Thermoplasmatota archaeon]